MTAIHPPPANPPLLEGVSDLRTLMLAIDNKKAVQTFLATWDDYLIRYESVLKGYGGLMKIAAAEEGAKTHEIEAARLHAQAEEAVAKAQADGEKLRADAEEIVRKARDELTAWEKRLQQAEEALRERQTHFNKVILDKERTMNERETEVKARVEAAVDRENAVNAQIEKMRAAGITVIL